MRHQQAWLRALAGFCALAAIVESPAHGTSRPAVRADRVGAPASASHRNTLPSVPQTALPVPAFQALDPFGVLAVSSATQVLAMPVPIQFDANLPSADSVFWGGLARDPASGEIYIAGSGITGDSYLGLVDSTTGQETTIGTVTGELVVDLAFDGAGHLYALTDNTTGTHHHALLLLDRSTAAASVATTLDSHGGGDTGGWFGAIAYNPADGTLYYSSFDSAGHLFIDKLALPTLIQTSVLQTQEFINPTAMAFSQGRLWIASDYFFVSADATNLAAGLNDQKQDLLYPTQDGLFAFNVFGVLPAGLTCLPSPTVACIGNRFKIEVAYDATPANGAGSAGVVLESATSVKFTFFDLGNIEMIVKVLNACKPFNKWWVFAGGLTNVGVTIKVTDTSNGATRSYASTKGEIFQAFADTEAFSCP
jgi:hypothetical protein